MSGSRIKESALPELEILCSSEEGSAQGCTHDAFVAGGWTLSPVCSLNGRALCLPYKLDVFSPHMAAVKRERKERSKHDQ